MSAKIGFRTSPQPEGHPGVRTCVECACGAGGPCASFILHGASPRNRNSKVVLVAPSLYKFIGNFYKVGPERKPAPNFERPYLCGVACTRAKFGLKPLHCPLVLVPSPGLRNAVFVFFCYQAGPVALVVESKFNSKPMPWVPEATDRALIEAAPW